MKAQVKEYVYITFAMFLISCSVYYFLVPSQIVVGSVSGLSMVLSNLTGLSIPLLTLVLNLSLLIIGFLIIGKEFGVKTVYTSILLSVYLQLFEIVTPLSGSLTNNVVIDLLSYILLIGFGQAMLFHVNASSGGLDIVAKIVSKYTNMDIGKAVTISGMVTACTSIFVYDISTLIISLLGTYANGLAIDWFIDGFNKKKKICILSDDYEKIQKYIMYTMKRGVTLYEAIGGYNQVKKKELVTIMSPYEYKDLLHYLHSENIHAFVTVYTVNEVIGTWNK